MRKISTKDIFAETDFSKKEQTDAFIERFKREFPSGSFVRCWFLEHDRETSSSFGVIKKYKFRLDEKVKNFLIIDMTYLKVNIHQNRATEETFVLEPNCNFIELATLDEFKEYQTEKLNSYIKGAKENIKLQKYAIRNYKKTLKDVEKISDLNKITTRYIVR